jgi:hypothetical protein
MEELPPEDRRQANSQKKIGLNLIVRKLTDQVKRVLDSFLNQSTDGVDPKLSLSLLPA